MQGDVQNGAVLPQDFLNSIAMVHIPANHVCWIAMLTSALTRIFEIPKAWTIIREQRS